MKLLTVADISGLSGTREFPGITQPVQEADLAFRVSGTLKELPVEGGQDVQQGDLLARLDPRDFETAIKQMTATLEGAQAQLKGMKAGARPEQVEQLKSSVKARQAQVDEVQSRYQRFQDLFKEEVVSKQQVDAVKAEYNVAVSQLEAAQQQLAEGQKGARDEDVEAQESKIRVLESQLRNARNQLSDTELHAPFNGVVARISVENFEEIMPKQTILTMQDLSQIEIVVDVPESDVALVSQSGLSFKDFLESFTRLSANFPTYQDRHFPVQLTSYETEADAATQTFRFTLSMTQPDDVTIRPGMNVTILLEFSGVPAGIEGTNAQGILIPAQAVFADASGEPTVWLVSPDTQQVLPRKVLVGEIYADRIFVLEGLQAGDVIAVSAVHSLREGMKVSPMPNLEDL